MSAAADCSTRWVDDNGKDHECYEDPGHGGGHQCGCGARVPRHLLDASAAERERIAAALADLDQVPAIYGPRALTHDDDCWQIHVQCLAARIRRTLTGEDHHG